MLICIVLWQNVCTLQELLAPEQPAYHSDGESNRLPIVSCIMKSLPKRCMCRNLEPQAIEHFLKMPILPRIYRMMLLGNTVNASYRLPLLRRIALAKMSDEELLETVVKKMSRSMSFALALMAATTVDNLLPFLVTLLGSQSTWNDYWRNVRLVCDRVYRPAFAQQQDVTEYVFSAGPARRPQ